MLRWIIVGALVVSCGVMAAQTPKADDPANAGRKALTTYLNGLGAEETAARHTAVAAITTRQQAVARQTEVRRKLVGLLGGLPEKTPLKARVTGSTEGDGFRIEKVLYESQPGFPVTALLYVPKTPGKHAAIVVAPGHGPQGKASDYLFSSAFAKNGFVVLDYDPIGQGERLQYPDPAKPGTSLATRPTGEHGMAGLQPTLIGDALAKYFAWDGMRAVDYLLTRSEVDGARIGAFGCSGGGAMTALLGALDTRIQATGTACYITSFDALLGSIGPQDSEQSSPGFIAAGLDFPDWVEVTAPKPYAIIATTSDMFPFAGAQATEAEARKFYEHFGASGKLEFITGPGGHGNLRPILGKIVGFFMKNLEPGSDFDHPVLPPPPAPGASPFAPPPLPKEAFQVTETGQVATSFPNADTVHSLTLKRYQAMSHKQLHDLDLRSAIYVVTRASRQIDGVNLPGILASPPESKHYPAILLLDEAASAPRGSVERKMLEERVTRLVKDGNTVLAMSLRPSPSGTEETKSPLLGTFYLTELRAELVGRTLMGLRIDDIRSAIRYLEDQQKVDPKHITVVATGHFGLAALHAAVLDSDIAHVTVDHVLESYKNLLETPVPIDAPQDILPGVVKRYDIPELRRALGSRLTWSEPVDGTGKLIAPK